MVNVIVLSNPTLHRIQVKYPSVVNFSVREEQDEPFPTVPHAVNGPILVVGQMVEQMLPVLSVPSSHQPQLNPTLPVTSNQWLHHLSRAVVSRVVLISSDTILTSPVSMSSPKRNPVLTLDVH